MVVSSSSVAFMLPLSLLVVVAVVQLCTFRALALCEMAYPWESNAVRSFPTLQLLIALVDSNVKCPIAVSHAVWFNKSGDVEGHFYIPGRKTSGVGATSASSSTLQFSKHWPPAALSSIERGEDALTRRRRQRRNVFESFTASAAPSSAHTQQASDVEAGARSAPPLLGRRLRTDICGVLIHPPPLHSAANSDGLDGPCVDFLDASRLQQFCDIPPHTSDDDDNSGDQEALLLAFPSLQEESWKFTTVYTSATLLPKLAGRRTGAEILEPHLIAVEMQQSSCSVHDVAATVVERTTTDHCVAVASGLKRRLSEVSSVLSAAFPRECWMAGDTHPKHRSLQRGKLSVFLIVEGDVRHVERFALLCAAVVPQARELVPTEDSTAQMNDTGIEDISWNVDEARASKATQGASGVGTSKAGADVSRNHVAQKKTAMTPEERRWKFTKSTSKSSETFSSRSPTSLQRNSRALSPWDAIPETSATPLHPASSSVPFGHPLVERRWEDPVAGNDFVKMLLQHPGAGFLLATAPSSTLPVDGRYKSDFNPVNLGDRPPWQAYQQQQFLANGRNEQHHSRQSVGGKQQAITVSNPSLPAEPSAPALTQADFVERLRCGSIGGYLVDPPLPIGRDPNASSVHQKRNQHVFDRTNDSDLISEELTQPVPSDAIVNISLCARRTSCLSSDVLDRLVCDEQRNREPYRTADPFVRVRRGLLPPMKRRLVAKHQKPDSSATSCTAVDEEDCLSVPSRTSRRGAGGAIIQQLLDVINRPTFLDRFLTTAIGMSKTDDEKRPEVFAGASSGETPPADAARPLVVSRAASRPAPISLAAHPLVSADRTSSPGSRSTPSGGGRTPNPLHALTALSDQACNEYEKERLCSTPRSWLREATRVDECLQCIDDGCYSVYSHYGGPPLAQLTPLHATHSTSGAHSRVVTQVASCIYPLVALEIVHWLTQRNAFGTLKEVLLTRAAEIHGSDLKEASWLSNDSQSSPLGEVLPDSGSSPTMVKTQPRLHCSVSVELPNQYALVSVMRSTLAKQRDYVHGVIENPQGHKQSVVEAAKEWKNVKARRAEFLDTLSELLVAAQNSSSSSIDITAVVAEAARELSAIGLLAAQAKEGPFTHSK